MYEFINADFYDGYEIIFLLLFLISFILCFGISLFGNKIGLPSRAIVDAKAVQRAHTGTVPRLGGVALIFCLLIYPLLLNLFGLQAVNGIWLVITAIPIFLYGLVEDIGFLISPRKRILGAVLSGLSAILYFGVWIKSTSIPGLDWLLGFAPIGLFFTLFAVAGVCNSFNLIDGLNGLSSYVAISAAISLAIIALQVGYLDLSIFMIFVVSSTFGFFLFNFPLGRVFLGDSGAYMLGHVLVWSAILLINFDSQVSPFAVLLVFFWPVADTGLAIWRRGILENAATRPDRLHFHQLAMRFIEIKVFGRGKRAFSNPIATLLIIPLITTPQILGVSFASNTPLLAIFSLIMVILFVLTYLIGIKLARNHGPLKITNRKSK